jgi:hypothetical protein
MTCRNETGTTSPPHLMHQVRYGRVDTPELEKAHRFNSRRLLMCNLSAVKIVASGANEIRRAEHG